MARRAAQSPLKVSTVSAFVSVLAFLSCWALILYLARYLIDDSKRGQGGAAAVKKKGPQSRRCQVFLDWPHEEGSDAFAYINYKSLESILVAYPKCHFEVMVMGPHSMNYYRVGNLLSKHFFEKYSKMGYWVDVTTPMSKEYKKTALDTYTYWSDNFELCCSFTHGRRKDLVRTRASSALHFYVFQRLVSLAEGGGVYSDFSWIHNSNGNGPGATGGDGALFLTYCDDEVCSIGDAQTREACRQRHGNGRCKTSSLLFFQAESPVPQCVLRKYHYAGEEKTTSLEASSGFLPCIYADKKTGGVECIQAAFEECFRLGNSTNELAGQIEAVVESAVKLWSANITTAGGGGGGEMQGRRVRWLGPKATDGQWTLPPRQSPLFAEIELIKTKLTNRVLKLASIPSSHCPAQQTSLRPWCSHYSTHNASRNESDGAANGRRGGGEGGGASLEYLTTPAQLAQASVSCAPNFAIAGFMKAGTSFLFDCLTRHPQIVHALRGVVFKETGCYLPNSMLPKRAAQRMMCFPFIEPGQGIIFGDGTVYNAGGRETPWHFRRDNPDIKVIFVVRNPVERAESHHRFNFPAFKSFGLQDMNAMVDIALDEDLGGLVELRRRAEHALQSRAGEARDAAMQALVDLYHGGVARECSSSSSSSSSSSAKSGRKCDAKRYHRAANVIFHSLYICAIFHWRRVLGSSNVLVVNSESFDLRATGGMMNTSVLDNTLARVTEFLGICPFTIKNRDANLDFHVTYTSIPSEFRLNDTSRHRLQVFFEPFSRLLLEYNKQHVG